MAPSTTIGAIILLWRRAATKVIVSHLPSGTATRGSPSQSRHVRADGSLVDEHQTGRIKHTLLSYPPAARSRHICSLPFDCLQGFFESDVVSVEKTPKRAAA